MLDRMLRMIAERPGPVLAVSGVVTLFFALQVVDVPNLELRLEVQTEIEKILPSGGEDREVYQRFVDRFGSYDMVFVGLTGADVFTSDSLARIQSLTRQLERLKGVRRVLSLSNAPGVRSEDGDVQIAAAFDEVPSTPEGLERLRQRILDDPMYVGNLVSSDGRATALLVYPQEMSEQEFRLRGIDQAIERVAREEIGDTATVLVAGNPALKATTGRILLGDLLLLIPASYALMAIIAFASFRTIRGVAVPLLAIGAAQIWTMGTMVLFDRPLNLVTFIVPILINAVGFAYTVHVVAEHDHVLGRGSARGPSSGPAALIALRREIFPVFLTAVTTAAGFASLCLSALPAIRFFASIVIAPAALSLAERRGATAARPRHSERVEQLATRLGEFDLAHRRAILLSGALIAALAAYGLTLIELSTSFVANLERANPVRIASEAFDDDMGGSTSFHAFLRGEGRDTFNQPDKLAVVQELQQWLEEQPEISKAISVVDYLKVLNRAYQEGDPAAFAIPASQRAVSQLLFFFWNDQLADLITADYADAHILMRAPSLDSRHINEFIDRVESRLAELPEGMSGRITGDTVLVGRTMDDIAQGQAASLSGAVLIIYAILVAYFRSLRVAALALLPNALPVLVYFGTLGLTGVTLNIISSLIACIVLGIAVDDTIHFMVRFREQAQLLGNEEQAVVAALRIVARPVTATTVALCAGFLVLAASGLRHQVEFAILATCMLAFAWLVDVTFTPALCARLGLASASTGLGRGSA